MRCVSRQEAGTIMLVPVISVACNLRQKTCSFPVPLHANVFVEASICRLLLWFTNGTQKYWQSDWGVFFLSSSWYSSWRRGTCDGKSIIHPRNLWARGSNLTGGHYRLSCPRSADTALKPYLTLLLPSFWRCLQFFPETN